MDAELAREVQSLAAMAGGQELELMRQGLESLARVAPYDLATVFALEGQDLVVKAAHGALADERVARHRISLLEFPSVREAIESGHGRAFTADDHAHGDGDPFDGVLDLPDGHACMVVPLAASEQVLGVLTLDRSECVAYSRATVELVEIYARLLAHAIRNAKLSAALAQLSEQRLEHAKELEDRLVGETVLEESLSPAVKRVAELARQVAPTDTPVLVRGETGTGKERLAHAIHRASLRAEGPFVGVNCAAIPAALLESELFGHAKGAFTGATSARAGRFRVADGGTLFLDEIGELPLELQAKLLRAVQEGEVQPVGSDSTVSIDVRLIAATHVELERAIAEGRFREDLFYRLNVFPLTLPPLRERLEDLPLLCERLLHEQAARTHRPGMTLSEAAMRALEAHAWPGNIRELANTLERAAIVAQSERIEVADLALPGAARSTSVAPVASLEEVERAHVARVLRITNGKIYGRGGAAEILGLKPSTLQSRMKKLGLERLA